MFTHHITSLVIAAAATPDLGGFVSALRDFVAPIFLLILGFVAIQFLLKKELRGFIEFIGLAVLVAVLFYYPGIIPAIASWVAGLFYGGTAPATTGS